MPRPWIPRLRIRWLLALIAGVAVVLALVRPTTREINTADARRIATSRLAADLAKDHPETPKTLYTYVIAPGSGKYGQGPGPIPAAAAEGWRVEIGFTVGPKATGKGYYTIATDGAVTGAGLFTTTSP